MTNQDLIQLPSAKGASIVVVSHNGKEVATTLAQALEVADELVCNGGPGVPTFSYWAPIPAPAAPKLVIPTTPFDAGNPWIDGVESPEIPAAYEPVKAAPAPVYSDFGTGNQVVDQAAKARIEALHVSLGVTDTSEQLFETGTRMAKEGYDVQRTKKREHDAKMPLAQAISEMTQVVVDEAREDHTVTAAEFAKALTVNGKIRAFGFAVSEQAIRGLMTRTESPSLGYILGLRTRIAAEMSKDETERNVELMRGDRAKIADILQYECTRAGDVALNLRTRKGPGDIFAVLSPKFAPADAPRVLEHALKNLPQDVKGTWSYDPTSTAWEIRAELFTPTPVDEQAVGEPFEGDVSFQSRDNGTSRFRSGGGIMLIRCLNASTYEARNNVSSRIHKGATILPDIAQMAAQAEGSFHKLCEFWGKSRAQEVTYDTGVPLEVAIPGFWRALLTDRRSELVGVLPGRTETHVDNLSKAFHAERRDADKVVRADFAQGWTRYIQDQPTPIRREAETAIGDWLASSRKMACDLRA